MRRAYPGDGAKFPFTWEQCTVGDATCQRVASYNLSDPGYYLQRRTESITTGDYTTCYDVFEGAKSAPLGEMCGVFEETSTDWQEHGEGKPAPPFPGKRFEGARACVCVCVCCLSSTLVLWQKARVRACPCTSASSRRRRRPQHTTAARSPSQRTHSCPSAP